MIFSHFSGTVHVTGAKQGLLSFEAVAHGFTLIKGEASINYVFFSSYRDKVKENQTTTNLLLLELKGVVPALNTAL